jgi:predicted component of type VI protein secretion system
MQKIITWQAAPSVDFPRVELEIRPGAGRPARHVVSGPVFLIGSAPDCDLVLDDPSLGNVHSYVLVTPDNVTICRVGTGPALTAAGHATPWTSLRNNDRVRFGSHELRFAITWPSGTEPHESADEDRGSSFVRLTHDTPAPQGAAAETRHHVYINPQLSFYVETGPDGVIDSVPGESPLNGR